MSASELAISGAQCRAARALTDVSREMLAEQSGVSEAIIREFEAKVAHPCARDADALRSSLELFGAQFLPDDSHGGAGVRLKFSASESRRISRLENEGGPVAEDDVNV